MPPKYAKSLYAEYKRFLVDRAGERYSAIRDVFFWLAEKVDSDADLIALMREVYAETRHFGYSEREYKEREYQFSYERALRRQRSDSELNSLEVRCAFPHSMDGDEVERTRDALCRLVGDEILVGAKGITYSQYLRAYLECDGEQRRLCEWFKVADWREKDWFTMVFERLSAILREKMPSLIRGEANRYARRQARTQQTSERSEIYFQLRREKILDALRKLASEGKEVVSINQMADASGVSKVAFGRRLDALQSLLDDGTVEFIPRGANSNRCVRRVKGYRLRRLEE